MAAPKTLEELCTLASITVDDLKVFEPADFEELTKELGLPVTAKVKLRGLHRKLLESCAEDGGGAESGGADGAAAAEAAGGGGVAPLRGEEAEQRPSPCPFFPSPLQRPEGDIHFCLARALALLPARERIDNNLPRLPPIGGGVSAGEAKPRR